MNIKPYIDIFSSSIVKNGQAISLLDTYDMKKAYEVYRLCKLGTATVSIFDYTVDDFVYIGFTEDEAKNLISNKGLIQDRINSKDPSGDLLRAFLAYMYKKVIDNYIEMNPYVRMLMGLPKYETYLEIEKDPTSYTLNSVLGGVNIYGVRSDVKLYNLTDTEIKIIKSNGLLESINLKYSEDQWVSYLDKRMDPFEIREASDYSLLYVDHNTNPDLAIVFEENYNKAMNYFKNVLANKFYRMNIRNYDATVMVYLLISTICLTMVDVANEKFTIDFNDVDLITAILNSAGLPYIDLPKLYLEPFIYNLEKMNQEKGSKQVLIDIGDIFNFNYIYRYLIYRKPVKDILDATLTNNEKYDLYFVKVPYETMDVTPYLMDESNHIKYIDMVLDDPYWGTKEDKLYSSIINSDFNYYETKYISIENMFEFTKNTYEFTTIFKYILNNKSITNTFKIQHGRGNFFEFSLFEGFVFIPALILKLKGWNDVIPETIDGVNFVMGFNVDNIDFNKYINIFKMYLSDDEALKNISQYKQNVPITDINIFIDTFINNKKANRVTQELMINAKSYDEFKILKELNDTITIVEAVKDIYKDPNGNQLNSYVEYLKYYSPNLYQIWLEIYGKDSIQEELTYIINLMEDYMNKEDDPLVSGELSEWKNLSEEFGLNLFKQLKTILKYYKYLTIELKDYTMIFKVDSMLEANRAFEELRSQENISQYSINRSVIEIINHKEETVKMDNNKSSMQVICIDGDGVTMFK